MKKILMMAALFAVLTFLLPFTGLLLPSAREAPSEGEGALLSPPKGAEAEGSVYHILNETTGEVDTVSVRDFLIGAVSSEMPLTFAPEALKAQIVAAHSYAEARREAQAAAERTLRQIPPSIRAM